MLGKNLISKLVLCLILMGFGSSDGSGLNQNLWRSNESVSKILEEYKAQKTSLVTVKCLECTFEKEISFKDFHGLETLYLPFSNFSEGVPNSFLENLTNLKNLDLSSAKGVPGDLTLKDLPKSIEILRLNAIELKEFFKSCDFKSIAKLELASTGITEFKLSDDCSVSKLEVLDLSSNRIEKLSEISWTKAKSLLDLNLENCELEKLPNFESLSHLEKINLGKNKIEKFSKIAHVHLVKLDLSSNTLRDFDDNNLQSLETLILSYNKLEKFAMDKEFPKLKHLKLNNNNLDKIEIKSMQNHLEELNLGNNRLAKFGLDDLSYFPQLKTINLINNNLQKIDEFEILVKKLNIHYGQRISNEKIELDLYAASDHLIHNLTELIRNENGEIKKSLKAIESYFNPKKESWFSLVSIAKFLLYVVLIGLFGYVAFLLWRNCVSQDRLINPTANSFEMGI